MHTSTRRAILAGVGAVLMACGNVVREPTEVAVSEQIPAPTGTATSPSPTSTPITATDKPTDAPTPTPTATLACGFVYDACTTSTPRLHLCMAEDGKGGWRNPDGTKFDCAPYMPTPAPTPVPVSLIRVIDGDTIEVAIGGQKDKVRYIGINTPESGEPCFDEATDFNTDLLSKGMLTLALDKSERDRYDRLLRYVYAGDTFVNAELVAQGYALAADYPPDSEHANEFAALEQQARIAKRGCLFSGEGVTAVSRSSYVCAGGEACIKGNISSNGHIYHYPGCASYEATDIDESKEERWFSSGAEAEAAGWREAGNC